MEDPFEPPTEKEQSIDENDIQQTRISIDDTGTTEYATNIVEHTTDMRGKILIITMFVIQSLNVADEFINLGFEDFEKEGLVENQIGELVGSLPKEIALPGWDINYPFGIKINNRDLGVNIASLVEFEKQDYTLMLTYSLLDRDRFESYRITQTGTIPEYAMSLQGTVMFGQGVEVYIDNNKVFTETRDRKLYANLDGYAGKEVELKITNQTDQLWSINNLKFSAEIVPEPSAVWYAMFVLGIIAIGITIKTNKVKRVTR